MHVNKVSDIYDSNTKESGPLGVRAGVSALNMYLDKKKFPTRCLRLEVEQESGLVWYTTGNYYCYKRTPELEKKINVAYDPDNNIYITPVQHRKTKLRVRYTYTPKFRLRT